jgi:hypothetical protein
MIPDNPIAVLSGDKDLQISFSLEDIAYLSVGVFLAMLAALLIAKSI